MSLGDAHRVDPSQGPAEERVGGLISRALILAAAFAAASVVATGAPASVLAGIAVGIVTSIPIVRVAWLVKRWAGQRDMRFAWAAVLLLLLIAVGPLLGFLQR
jgi:hypothetical protein